MPHRYVTVIRYRLPKEEPREQDGPNHLQPDAVEKDSADKRKCHEELEAELAKSFDSSAQDDEGGAEVSQPFDYPKTKKSHKNNLLRMCTNQTPYRSSIGSIKFLQI